MSIVSESTVSAPPSEPASVGLQNILTRNGSHAAPTLEAEALQLVTELVKNRSEGTVEARAPLPYRHDEWTPGSAADEMRLGAFLPAASP